MIVKLKQKNEQNITDIWTYGGYIWTRWGGLGGVCVCVRLAIKNHEGGGEKGGGH